jgi:drug/metabolite transporter (DMT)-like permease
MIKQALIFLHVAVFLFGFTAILGKLLIIDEYSLVWWRMMIAGIFFLFIPGFQGKLKSLSRKQVFIFLPIGVLVALHWITFYGSIKAGDSASLTLACFGLTASFTSIIEPLVNRQRWKWYEVSLGLIAFVGLYLIYIASPDMEKEGSNIRLAITLGVISSALAALFSSLNAKYIKNTEAEPVTFLELAGGFVFVTLFLLFHPTLTFEGLGGGYDVWWMLLLTLVCTNLAFVLNLKAMKVVNAFTANIAINLEPIYGILLAAVIFGENKSLNTMFYLGTAVILFTVFIHPVIQYYKRKASSEAH